MAAVSMKAIVLNDAALTAKYGAAGRAAIHKALGRMIAADAKRGIKSRVFDIADKAQMKAVKGVAVAGPKDQAGAKAAVDAIHEAHLPDYIMLLDGPDVVPHIGLHHIAGITDADSTTDSDLPYASAAPFDWQAAAYLAVTRVVGRLPAARGETDPATLIGLIDASIAHGKQTAAPGGGHFAISTDAWTVSTQMSLTSVFGSAAALFVSPKDGHTAIDKRLAQGAHFINCHGAQGDWRFYGEKAGAFPVAMDAPGVTAAKVGSGAVVAAECCYGAELYNYLWLATHPPLCLTYLWKGAAAVLGSTNIAYGPAAGNGQADYLTQFFLKEVLAGASTGRALLQARQSFVGSQTMSTPVNLKTLAQFLLLGDPSLHPVMAPKATQGAAIPAGDVAPKGLAKPLDPVTARRMRRFWLDSEGKAVASSASRVVRKAAKASPGVKQFMATARQHGYAGRAQVFTVGGGDMFKTTAKVFDQGRQLAIVSRQVPCVAKDGTPLFTSTKVMVGHMLGNGVYMIEECESR
ncbi:MAG: hypothetical protein EOP22_08535 [Hyphomicrobiales bacterium]|nr:MAG: hypothetical protein EOP22_08535 [Hyphomicrobiales bacterium]